MVSINKARQPASHDHCRCVIIISWIFNKGPITSSQPIKIRNKSWFIGYLVTWKVNNYSFKLLAEAIISRSGKYRCNTRFSVEGARAPRARIRRSAFRPNIVLVWISRHFWFSAYYSVSTFQPRLKDTFTIFAFASLHKHISSPVPSLDGLTPKGVWQNEKTSSHWKFMSFTVIKFHVFISDVEKGLYFPHNIYIKM